MQDNRLEIYNERRNKRIKTKRSSEGRNNRQLQKKYKPHETKI